MYVVEAKYVADAANKRQPFRAEHLERLGKLFAEGALVLAGAFDDLSASLLVLDVESPKAAEAIVKTDVFWNKKVWTGYTIRKLNQVDFDG
ncbi:MAG: YciI family protein [Actinomycetota bacterium]